MFSQHNSCRIREQVIRKKPILVTRQMLLQIFITFDFLIKVYSKLFLSASKPAQRLST